MQNILQARTPGTIQVLGTPVSIKGHPRSPQPAPFPQMCSHSLGLGLSPFQALGWTTPPSSPSKTSFYILLPTGGQFPGSPNSPDADFILRSSSPSPNDPVNRASSPITPTPAPHSEVPASLSLDPQLSPMTASSNRGPLAHGPQPPSPSKLGFCRTCKGVLQPPITSDPWPQISSYPVLLKLQS